MQGQYNELSEEEKQILGAMLHNENEILQGGQDDEVVLRAMTIEEKMEEIDFNKNQEKGLSINQEILEILIFSIVSTCDCFLIFIYFHALL